MNGWFSKAARSGLIAIVLLGGALALGACGSDRSEHGAAAPAGPTLRIVTLSPHLAELVFAAGAGRQLVGVVEYSNFPAAARRLPRVGDAFRVDLEAIARLRPDLILGWPSGNSQELLDRLRRLGYRVVDLEPRTLADIGRHIRVIGAAAGTQAVASRAAEVWDSGLASLRQRYGSLAPIRVFYQIGTEPLVTATGRHFIGEAIRLCGGTNIFESVPGLTPVVSQEFVIAAAPEAIIAVEYAPGPASSVDASPLRMWRSWPGLPANRDDGLFVLDPDLLNIPGPRMLSGIGQLCASIDAVRQQRGARASSPAAAQ